MKRLSVDSIEKKDNQPRKRCTKRDREKRKKKEKKKNERLNPQYITVLRE